MELAFTAEERAFADEVRSFIAQNLPRDISDRVAHDLHLQRDDFMRWQQILAKRGWHTYTWPTAQSRGLPHDDRSVTVCGVRFEFAPAT